MLWMKVLRHWIWSCFHHYGVAWWCLGVEECVTSTSWRIYSSFLTKWRYSSYFSLDWYLVLSLLSNLLPLIVGSLRDQDDDAKALLIIIIKFVMENDGSIGAMTTMGTSWRSGKSVFQVGMMEKGKVKSWIWQGGKKLAHKEMPMFVSVGI